MPAIPVTHVFTHFRKLGGVESLLKRHLEVDSRVGLESQVLALFEPAGEVAPRVWGAGYSWTTSAGLSRRLFASQAAHVRDRVAVYHNCWGLSFLGDLDGSARRLALHHSDWPGVEHVLRAQAGLVDGVLCIGTAVLGQVRRELPGLAAERTVLLPLPISPPPNSPSPRSWGGRPLVIGVCGRVVKAQKRVDRLPDFTRELDAAGVSHRLEILGDGPERPWLERALGSRSGVIFHGRQTGDVLWRILDGWDVIFFASDYEGLPLALLEALSRGVLPLYPRIASGGDEYVSAVKPSLLYEAGDLRSAAMAARDLAGLSANAVTELRQSAAGQSAPHTGDSYERTLGRFVERISVLPRVSSLSARPRLRLGHWIPFGLMNRLSPHRWPRRGIL